VDVVPAGVDVVPAGVDVVPDGVDVVPAGVDVVPDGVDVVPDGVDVVPAGVDVVPAVVDGVPDTLIPQKEPETPFLQEAYWAYPARLAGIAAQAAVPTKGIAVDPLPHKVVVVNWAEPDPLLAE